MKFPENSPYNKINSQAFKPNDCQPNGGKKAEFQGHLIDSSVKFTLDPRNNKFNYNSSPCGKGGDQDYVQKVDVGNLKLNKGEENKAKDRSIKTHLTQM